MYSLLMFYEKLMLNKNHIDIGCFPVPTLERGNEGKIPTTRVAGADRIIMPHLRLGFPAVAASTWRRNKRCK